MKKTLLLCSLLISTHIFAASHEMGSYERRSRSGFSIAKGITTALVLASSLPETEAASIRSTSKDLKIVPDGFPVFVQYDGYYFDPAKLNYVGISQSDTVYLTFQAGGTISFNFNSTATATQFINDMLFANILDLDSAYPKSGK